MCCNNKSRLIVGFLNLLFLALGITVVAIASWGVNHVHAFEGLLNGGTIQTATAAGALLIVVSALGFFGALLVNHKFGRFLLIVYNISLFGLLILTLAGAALVVVFANKVRDSHINANDEVNTTVHKIWNKCCSGGMLVKDCPFYDFFHNTDCQSYNAFFSRFQDFVKENFGAIAGVLFGAAVLQLLTSIMTCVIIRRGRETQHQRERDEKATHYHAAPVVGVVYAGSYLPPQSVPQNQFNQPHVAQDHRF